MKLTLTATTPPVMRQNIIEVKRDNNFNKLCLKYLSFANFTKTYNYVSILLRPINTLSRPYKVFIQMRVSTVYKSLA